MTTNQERFLRPEAAAAKVGLSRATLYRLMRTGGFPAPVRVSEGRVAWPESWVERWMADRMAEVEQA